jgi:hypothetical protein
VNRPTLSALLAAPLLTALSPVADDLSFHPSDGSEVTRRYTIELDFELGDLSIVADGQDVSEMVPSDQMSGAAEIAMKVTESFVRSAEGRPLELIRYFEEMSGEAGPEGQAEAMEDIDKLEGKRVRFLWNEDEGAYDVTFHESEGDAEDLEGLTPDMDLRALLPGKEVSAGDTWSIDAKELHSVLLFGDKPESGDEQFEELLKSSVWPQVQTLMDQFKTTCEYLGERDVDGRKVGAIAVTMHGEGRIDLSQFILEVFQMQVGEAQVDLDISKADVALTFDSKGELLWDLAGGHLRAFDMACDADVALEFSGSADVQGESHSADADAEFAVTGNWKVAPAE